MPDVVVTLPVRVGLEHWADEGQQPGEPPNGTDYYWYLGRHHPTMLPGERVYVTYRGRLLGYAPLVRIEVIPPDRWNANTRYALVRQGGAVAVTLRERVEPCRSFRYRWWRREDEIPYAWTNALPQPPRV